MIERYVLAFSQVGETRAADVGGKGANLGELSRIEGIRVPAGVCVTTDAFRRILADTPSVQDLVGRLSRLRPDGGEAIRARSVAIRGAIERAAMPDDVASAITDALVRLGVDGAYAVRSSATAEDMPGNSFAGQHDTYLNVAGRGLVLA